MDAKPHYFKIGIFVLIAVALITVAIILFGAGLFAQNELYVESYFAESITGLSVGSPLEFRGVRIGHVARIGFVGNQYKLDEESGAQAKYASYVRVVSGVLRAKLPELDDRRIETVLEQMIERGLRVRVTSNILTGQAYLEANYLDPNRFPAEEVPWKPRYPVIPSAPSELTTIKDSIDSILTQLQEIDVKGLVESLDRVFASLDTAISEAGLAELSMEARGLLRVSREKIDALETGKINADVGRLLGSLNQTVADANVPALSQEAQSLIAELRTTNDYLQDLLAPPAGAERLPNVPEAVARLSQTISQLNNLLATERPELETILTDIREITDSLTELVSTLKERPSEILFSKPPRQSEVFK